ncbi:MAG: YceI family protein [Gemmatimonadota bacterium]
MRGGIGVSASLAGLAAAAFLAFPGGAAAQEFQVDLDAANVVRFISRASIEEFEGVTDRIDGYVYLPGVGPDGTLPLGEPSESELYFEVDLASLDTGIGLRNRHMRDNYLEVEKFPYATYEARILSVAEGSGGSGREGYRVISQGDLSIHGVTRRVRIPCDTEPEDASGFAVRCAFQVLLSDYEIEIPRVMFLKLANEIRLEVEMHLRPAPASSGETK